MQEHITTNNRTVRQPISLPCWGFCAVLFLILGSLPLWPSSVTQLLRPLVIAMCLFPSAKNRFRLNRSSWALILFHVYATVIFLMHPWTSDLFITWASMVLFVLFYVVLTERPWTKEEIRLILNVVLISCVFFCSFLLWDNPRLFQNDMGEVTFFGRHVNSNSAAFAIVPGVLVGSFFLFFSPHTEKKGRLLVLSFYVVATILSCLMLVGMGGRSAFFSALIGVILIAWEWGGAIKNQQNRIVFRVFLVILLLSIYHFGPIWTEGTHAYRLFDYDRLADMNGRDNMAERALELINENPFFGGGFGYWDFKTNHSLMVHNTFLADGVWGGYTAIILLGLFFLLAALELLQTRSLIPFAFFVEALFHSLTEPGMDYYAYIPLILAVILNHYAQAHSSKPKNIILT